MKTQALYNDCIRDLIVDIRCAKRDGLAGYEARCRKLLSDMLAKRHTPVLDNYGYPTA